jgi:diguanylate cyclase (GGDEF)-like protein
LYIDLHDLKHVNDSLGNNIGDLLFKEIARRLTSACRDTGFVARLSGDEFSILVKGVPDKRVATSVAQVCLEKYPSHLIY